MQNENRVAPADRRQKSLPTNPDRRIKSRRKEDIENHIVYLSVFIFVSIIILLLGVSALFYSV